MVSAADEDAADECDEVENDGVRSKAARARPCARPRAGWAAAVTMALVVEAWASGDGVPTELRGGRRNRRWGSDVQVSAARRAAAAVVVAAAEEEEARPHALIGACMLLSPGSGESWNRRCSVSV